MTLPRYPEYKDSGVEWLGEVPAHWEVVQFKRFVDIQNGSDHKHVVQDDGYPVIGSGGAFAFAAEFLYDGESVLLGRKGTIDRPLYVSGRFWTVDTMFWTKINPAVCGRFTYFAATTIPFDLYSTQTALPSMTKSSLSGHLVARPPLPEQVAIAAFLDRETAKIDELVAEQRRLMELLKEKRQAVISHAVTRGLNPDAPMRPSGIEWLGDVPVHWEEYPLKALFSIKHGYAFDGAAFSDSGEHVLMTPGHFHEKGGFRRRDSEKFYVGDDIPLEFILQSGQMLVAMTEQAPGLLGSALFVPDGASYLHNQRLGLVHGLRSEVLSERFLFHLLNSLRLRATISVSSTGAKVKHTSPSRILSIQVIVPPLSEQLQIAAFLDRKTLDFDELEAAAQKSIALLQERRTALISAAVTGQLDVRGIGESSAS